MEAASKRPAKNDPVEPPPFRFLAAGTFTGGKSFWLTPTVSTNSKPEPKRRLGATFRRGPNEPGCATPPGG